MRKSTGSAAASVSPKNQPAIAAHPDARLLWLGQCLADIDAQRDLCGDDQEAVDDPLYKKHWAIREEINSLTASTLAGLQVKSRAAVIALRRDPEVECDVAGSYRELSKSLAFDVLAMGGAHV